MSAAQLVRIDPKHNLKVEAALESSDLSGLVGLCEPIEWQADLGVASKLGAHAIKSCKDDDDLDQWLAPRIHNLIRIPRSVAADSGLWCWLATGVFRPYVERRWPKRPESTWWRYNDRGILRNGVARLWWAAELVRSGPDYTLVPLALAAVRTLQNVSELRYSWHREAARAFTRVLNEKGDLGDELSPVFNAYLATQALEQFDTPLADAERENWDPGWAKGEPSLPDLLVPVGKLKGPKAGYARPKVEERIYKWLSNVFDEIA